MCVSARVGWLKYQKKKTEEEETVVARACARARTRVSVHNGRGGETARGHVVLIERVQGSVKHSQVVCDALYFFFFLHV